MNNLQINIPNVIITHKQRSEFCYCISPTKPIEDFLFGTFMQNCFCHYAKTLATSAASSMKHVVLIKFYDAFFHKYLHFCYAYRKQLGLELPAMNINLKYIPDVSLFVELLIAEYFENPNHQQNAYQINPIYRYNSFSCVKAFQCDKANVVLIPDIFF